MRTIVRLEPKDVLMAPRLKLVGPDPEKRTVLRSRPAGRPPNRELRTREHLTPAEVERLIEAAKHNRQGHRDAMMILIRFQARASRVRACRSSLGADRP
jgi:hypothetical protein